VHQKNTIATGNLTRFYVKINTRKSLTHTRARGRKNNMKIMFVHSCTTHALHIVYLHIHFEYNKYVCAHFFIFSLGRSSTLYRCSSPQLQLLYENIPIRVCIMHIIFYYFIVFIFTRLPHFIRQRYRQREETILPERCVAPYIIILFIRTSSTRHNIITISRYWCTATSHIACLSGVRGIENSGGHLHARFRSPPSIIIIIYINY